MVVGAEHHHAVVSADGLDGLGCVPRHPVTFDFWVVFPEFIDVLERRSKAVQLGVDVESFSSLVCVDVARIR